jgi:glycosidase
MKRILFLLSITLLLFLNVEVLSAQENEEIIAPLKLKSGEAKSVLISDLFFADNYAVTFEKNQHININYSPSTKKVKFISDSSFTGVTAISFNLGGKVFSFPVIVEKKKEVLFQFNPRKNYKEVTIFGSFNDWNRHQYFMRKDNTGIYKVELEIEPGVYQYRIWADGEEFVDLSNPDSISNGNGGYNSVLTLDSDNNSNQYLAQLNFMRKNNSVVAEFLLASDKKVSLNKNDVFAFLNNRKITDGISVNDSLILIKLLQKDLSGFKQLRVIVEAGSAVSNIQTIFMKNGNPLNSSEKEYTWHDAIIYSLMIDRFYDGDKSNSIPVVHDSLSMKANYNGGDFAGILKKLNEGYFDSLGVNVIWISPVYDNPNKAFRESPKPHRWFTGYHGYWPINSFGVEEHFGTMEQLKEIVNTAHKHNIKVLLDFVSHHVHIDNPIYKEHRDWFGSLYLPDGSKNIRQWDSHRLTTWFEPYLPSFDFIHSDAAVSFMTSNALWWLRVTGADGFRHDAVKHVPNKFWRKLTKELKSEHLNNLYQIGETFGSYKLVSSYVNNGQLDAQFNFNLYNIAQAVFIDSNESFKSLAKELQKSFSVYGVHNLMGNILDSHDKNRYMAYADGDLRLEQWNATETGWKNPPEVNHPSSYKKAELYYSYMLTTPGVPVIYYGSEFGMTGASDPDNRRMMRFGKNLNSYEKAMLKRVSRLVKIRRENSALNYGDFQPVKITKNVFAYLRSDPNERILVVLNKSANKSYNTELEIPRYIKFSSLHDLISREKIITANHKVLISLKPLDSKIYKLK